MLAAFVAYIYLRSAETKNQTEIGVLLRNFYGARGYRVFMHKTCSH